MSEVVLRKKDEKDKGKLEETKDSLIKKYIEHKNDIYIIGSGALFLLLLILAPLTDLFVIFSVVFSLALYFGLTKIVEFIRALEIDIENEEIHCHKMRRRKFNDYDIKDTEGKASTVKYSFSSNDGKVVIVDKFDRLKKVMTIQQVCANLEFVLRYKERTQKLSKTVTRQLHKIIELLQDMQYKTLEKVYEKINEDPTLKAIFEQLDKEETTKEVLEIDEEDLKKLLKELEKLEEENEN